MPGRRRRARVEDVHAAASAMPHVSVVTGPASNPVYQVGGKSFVFFRTPRPDARDAVSGEPFDDVIVVWVASEDDKQALVQDVTSPWFTTAHFDGHPSVLVRASRLGELDRDELVEVVQEAWVARASPHGRRLAAIHRSQLTVSGRAGTLASAPSGTGPRKGMGQREDNREAGCGGHANC